MILSNVKDLKISYEVLNGGLSTNISTVSAVRGKYGQYMDKVIEKSQGVIGQCPCDHQIPILSCLLLTNLEESLNEDLQFHELEDIEALEQKVNVLLCKNIHNGFMVDQVRVKSLKDQLIRTRVEIRGRIQEILRGCPKRMILPNGSHTIDHLRNYLRCMGLCYEDLLEEEIFERFVDEPIVMEFRNLQKVETRLHDIESNLMRAIHPTTGRIMSEIHQFGTLTGRIVSKRYNYQYVPKKVEFRSCFIPAPGHKLIVADYSQSELVIAADLSQDQVLIEAIESGVDLHRLTASHILNKNPDDIIDSERTLGKGLNFGILYGMGAISLTEVLFKQFDLIVGKDAALDYIERFFEAYPGLKEWRDSIPTKGPYIGRTRLGRSRYFTDEPATKRWNFPIQGTGADLLKTALVLLQPELDKINGNFVGCVHDEIIVEVPDGLARDAESIVSEAMIGAGKIILKCVPILVDCSTRNSWYE